MYFFLYFFGWLECAGYSFAYVACFVLLGYVWIRTQRAAVANRCATNLDTYLPVSTYLAIFNSNSNINYCCKKGPFTEKNDDATMEKGARSDWGSMRP